MFWHLLVPMKHHVEDHIQRVNPFTKHECVVKDLNLLNISHVVTT